MAEHVRPARPRPARPRRAGRRRRAAPPRDAGRASASSRRAARPSTRRSRPTPSWRVVMPNGCGIGGDAFWLVWDEAAGRAGGDQRLRARRPRRPMRRRCASRGLDRIPLRGPLSITTPGAVRSWGDAHARWGRLSRDAVLAPAIEQAEAGFPAWDGLIAAVEGIVAACGVGAVGPRARGDLARERPAVATRRAGPPPGARRAPCARSPTKGSTRTTTATSGSGSPRPRRRRGAVHASPTCATTARRAAAPIATPTAASA